MTPLEKRGQQQEEKAKAKKQEARKKGDALAEQEAKEEELTGKLQQKYGNERERSQMKNELEG